MNAKQRFKVARIEMCGDAIRCKQCRQKWWPTFESGGKYPRGYWVCPNGCNLPSTSKELRDMAATVPYLMNK